MTELTHLLVGEEIFTLLAWPEPLRPTFYLGTIAPDAYRVVPGFTHRISHFRSRRRVGERLLDFLEGYLRPAFAGDDPEEAAFFAGWLSHLVADQVWRQMLQTERAALWHGVLQGPSEQKAALRQQFYEECDWLDGQLFEQEPERIKQIRQRLIEAKARFALPPLEATDIHQWRHKVVQELLPPINYTVEQPSLIDLDFVQRAIRAAVEEGGEMLAWEARQMPNGEEVV